MVKKDFNIFLYIPSFFWFFAGSLLLRKEFIYLIQKSNYFNLPFIHRLVISMISISLGLIKYQLIFRKMVFKQLNKTFKEIHLKEVLKTFFSYKKIFFIIPMILLSKLISYLIKEPFYTSPIKIGIGFALVLSSIIYTYSLKKIILKSK